MYFFQPFAIFIFLVLQTILLHPPQDKPLLLMNVIAHVGDEEKIDNAVVAFQNERITLVGDATRVRLDMSAFHVKKMHGKHVYAAVVADKRNFSASDSLYSVSLGVEELFIDLSAPALEEGREATLVVTEQAISEKGQATITMAFVKGKEVLLQEKCIKPVK